MKVISDIGVDASKIYAHTQNLVDSFKEQYHLTAAGADAVAIAATFQDLIPKPLTVTLLTGENIRTTAARFTAPENFTSQRTGSPYIVASPERLEANIQTLETATRNNPEDKEGQNIKRALEEALFTNKLADDAWSRVFEFLGV